MSDKRSPKGHETDRRGTYQLGEFFTNLGGWLMDKITDYGEDFIIRVSEKGRFPGFHFFVQLKSTESLDFYHLKTKPVFSYSITQKNLRQWDNFLIPVFVILWDTTSRSGYWLHIQPYIDSKVHKHPKWLHGDKERVIHIPEKNQISDGCSDDFVAKLYEIFKQLSLGQYLGRIGEISETAYLTQQLAAYEAMVNEYPKNPYMWANKASVHYALNQMEAAYHSINRAWMLNKADANIIYNRGSVLVEYGNSKDNAPPTLFYEAIKMFSTKKEPSASNHYNIGNALLALMKFNDAIQEYDKALELVCDHRLEAQIWKNRGSCFFELELYAEAILNFEQSLLLNPNLWQALIEYAWTKVRLEDYENALSLYDKALAVNTKLLYEHLGVNYYYSYCLWKLYGFKRDISVLENAMEWIDRALTIDPSHTDSKWLKAHLFHTLLIYKPEFTSEAIDFYESWLIDGPDKDTASKMLEYLRR